MRNKSACPQFGAICSLLLISLWKVTQVYSASSTLVAQDIFATGQTQDIVVYFGSDSEMEELAYQISDKYPYATKEQRVYYLYEALDGYSTKCQSGAISYLNSHGYTYTSYWSSNAVVVQKADPGCVKKLTTFSDIKAISRTEVQVTKTQLNEKSKVSSVLAFSSTQAASDPAPFSMGTSYALAVMHVPEAWKTGAYYGDAKTGKGVVVGQIATGVFKDHETLKDNFKEYNGFADGYNTSIVPFDSEGTGTVQLALAVGKYGIGVAPGAQWMACRGCENEENCDMDALLFCCQWMICPYDRVKFPNGPANYKDCYGSPDVLMSAWVLDDEDAHKMDRCIYALQAVGIIPLWPAWTDGPDCGTIATPANNAYVIGVGATDHNDALYWWSGRGPTSDGRIKPDFVAPGVSLTVPSISASDAYEDDWSGTIAATGHTSGVIALMLERCRVPYKTIVNILQSTADKEYLGKTTQVCGGTKYDDWPNNIYGWGRINALQAVRRMAYMCQASTYGYRAASSYLTHPLLSYGYGTVAG